MSLSLIHNFQRVNGSWAIIPCLSRALWPCVQETKICLCQSSIKLMRWTHQMQTEKSSSVPFRAEIYLRTRHKTKEMKKMQFCEAEEKKKLRKKMKRNCADLTQRLTDRKIIEMKQSRFKSHFETFRGKKYNLYYAHNTFNCRIRTWDQNPFGILNEFNSKFRIKFFSSNLRRVAIQNMQANLFIFRIIRSSNNVAENRKWN